ncbi:MAG: UDP-glucose 4-epimerase GalE [Eubacteriales bacterium]|nr:UDP-glucose 4-epimerase GalE [Eubacteriales bacterium]
MKVLLTGGTGFIGSHTYVELINEGFEPIIVDNYYNSSPLVLERLEKITGVKPIFYNINICNKDTFKQVFEENEIDCVIHFAGYKAVGESVQIPLAYYNNNLNSTLVLCELMQEYNVHNLVFSSSATVYGTNTTMPLTENLPTGCTNPYGWTKYMIEQILQDLCIANKDFSVALLRYFNPVGAHASGLIGESPKGIPNNLMPYITQVASGKLAKLRVFGNDYSTHDGTGKRDFIHVVDLARAHVAACKFLNKQKGCEVFNIGTGKGYTVLDLVQSFEKANGLSIPYEIVERRPGDIAECYADASKAKKLLHWEAKLDIVDMCKDAWNWQKNNPEGLVN